MVRGERTTFPTWVLTLTMKVWHHFIYARLVPSAYHSEVTKDCAYLLYSITKGLNINVGRWIDGNITYAANNTSVGLLHPTLLTELFAANSIDTWGDKVIRHSSGAGSSSGTGAKKTKATMADLTRAIDQQQAEMTGVKNWMLQKAAYDQTAHEALRAQLDMISLCCRVDHSTVPPFPPFPEQLTRAWTVKEEPCEEDDDDEGDE